MLAILVVLVLVISAPLRAGEESQKSSAQATGDRARLGGHAPPPSRELADLEAAREAKYREIRDTELDHATGKLSDEDFKAVDDRLRAEALRILDRIDGVVGERTTEHDHAPERS